MNKKTREALSFKWLSFKSRRLTNHASRITLALLLFSAFLLPPSAFANESVVIIGHTVPTTKPLPVTIVPPPTGTPTPQPVTDSNLGLKADTAASSDTGTFSLIALFKRALQKLTTLTGAQTDGTQKSQVVNAAGTEINTATTVASTALEASHVLKGSAGRLVSLHVFNSKTSAQYILVMNSATVTADGAVTLLYPPIFIPATSNISLAFPVPLTASTGISVANSSTGTFTKTIGSADCAFTAQVQ